jgi:hypothetical protein
MGRGLAIALLAACASAPKPPPAEPPGYRGAHASEHMAAARDQDRMARDAQMWPDVRPVDPVTGRVDSPFSDTPWRRQWDTPEQHELVAAAHRAAAAEQQAEFDRACGAFSATDAASSPIRRFGVGGVPTEDGVILFLSPQAGPAAHLLAEVDCHRAWMMLAPRAMDEQCPLDLAGIHVDAMGDDAGVTLKISVDDPALVRELQRRAATELEQTISKHAR